MSELNVSKRDLHSQGVWWASVAQSVSGYSADLAADLWFGPNVETVPPCAHCDDDMIIRVPEWDDVATEYYAWDRCDLCHPRTYVDPVFVPSDEDSINSQIGR